MVLSLRDRETLKCLRGVCGDIAEDIHRITNRGALDNDPTVQRSLAFSVCRAGFLIDQELSNDLKQSLPQISWSRVIIIGNLLARSPIEDNLDKLWGILTAVIPELARLLDEVLVSE